MYIIIAGAGIVGSHIASLLIEAKHEVAKEITNLFSSFYPSPVENFADGLQCYDSDLRVPFISFA